MSNERQLRDEAPEFSINPLSGIAPGFLRLLFEGKKGSIDDVDTPDVTAEPPSSPVPAAKTDTAAAPSEEEESEDSKDPPFRRKR